MYALEFQGAAFTPEGKQPIPDVKAHNLEVEKQEIEWLKTGPDKVFLYVRMSAKDEVVGRPHLPIYVEQRGQDSPQITTWLGTPVATHLYIGPRRQMGFGRHTYRRGVTCRIFGVLYHGWYMESSGDYCRLRKAKRQ